MSKFVVERIFTVNFCDAIRLGRAWVGGPKLTNRANQRWQHDPQMSLNKLASLEGLGLDKYLRAISLELISSSRGLAKEMSKFIEGYPFDKNKERLISRELGAFISFANNLHEEEVVIRLLLTAIKIYHPDTYEHQKRVAELCDKVALVYSLTSSERRLLRAAARIHDIGKLAVKEKYLDGQGLNDNQLWIVRQGHLEVGVLLLKNVATLKEAAEKIVAFHHSADNHATALNNWPITDAALILSMVDHYDALTNPRKYSSEKTKLPFEALNMIGEKFDERDTRCGHILNALQVVLDVAPSAYSSFRDVTTKGPDGKPGIDL